MKTTSSEDDLKGRITLCKNMLMEVDLNGSLTGLTLACLASQFYTELSPAQPQLVIYYFHFIIIERVEFGCIVV